jgi:hypothetical protein
MIVLVTVKLALVNVLCVKLATLYQVEYVVVHHVQVVFLGVQLVMLDSQLALHVEVVIFFLVVIAILAAVHAVPVLVIA